MSMKMALPMMLVLVASLAMGGSAQQPAGPAPCSAAKLVACQPYLNSTSPPESCCGPLKDALTNDLVCLCSIFNSPEIFKAFNINITQAMELPMHCGIPSFSTTNACSNTSAGAPGSSIFPPAVPGGDHNNNVAHGLSWLGLSGAASLFLFWWSIMG